MLLMAGIRLGDKRLRRPVCNSEQCTLFVPCSQYVLLNQVGAGAVFKWKIIKTFNWGTFKENEWLTRLAFIESVANEARHNSQSAKQFAKFALITSLVAIVLCFVALLR